MGLSGRGHEADLDSLLDLNQICKEPVPPVRIKETPRYLQLPLASSLQWRHKARMARQVFVQDARRSWKGEEQLDSLTTRKQGSCHV